MTKFNIKETGESVTIETFTPQQAADFLTDRNLENRPVSRANVKRWREVMNMGKWQVSLCHALVVDVDGLLVNGQHRLIAVSEGAKPVSFVVISNAAKSIMSTLDQQKVRNAPTVLKLEGFKSTAPTCAMARQILLNGRGVGELVPTQTKVMEFVRKNDPVLQRFVDLSWIKGCDTPMAAAFAHAFLKGQPVIAAAARFKGGLFKDGHDPMKLLNDERVKYIGEAGGEGVSARKFRQAGLALQHELSGKRLTAKALREVE